MKINESDLNNIDKNINGVTKLLRVNELYWVDEINSDGATFNYDSQDSYHCLIDKLPDLKLVETIKSDVNNEVRKLLVEDLEKEVDKVIKLFRHFKSLFEELPRKKVLIDYLRLRKYTKVNKSDKKIFDDFTFQKEIRTRSTYFNSELYKDFGFLENNYHEELYNYCLYIKNIIDKDFDDNNYYDRNYLNIHDQPFFNMGVVHIIHKNYSGIVFQDLSELEFYKALNLMNTIPYIKSKNNEKLFYIIHKLREELEDTKKELWLKGILKETGKSKKYYNSKYRTVVGSNATNDQQHFVEVLDTIFKENIKQLVS
ncbi:hypothetical protein [Leeuwenhoekiella marinoflava]|uniref:hypothetical protein n=1 Tax=Leeuwenhoekiella marinoflava TaxID=988 RepID=UPI0030019E08